MESDDSNLVDHGNNSDTVSSIQGNVQKRSEEFKSMDDRNTNDSGHFQ